MTPGSRPIEDYALLGDSATAALVSRTGSVDWWCPPRFDGPATFSALLGGRDHGRWRIGPDTVGPDDDGPPCHDRRYRDGTLLLETDWRTDTGAVRVHDVLAMDDDVPPTLVRVVEGLEGTVAMHSQLIVRFDYGEVVPWVRRVPGGITAVGGADAVTFQAEVPVHGEDLTTVATFDVAAGEQVAFTLTWHPSHLPAVQLIAPHEALASTGEWWSAWISRCHYRGPWEDAVRRSLVVLKALTYAPTGGIVAAATTSLPESPGGVRNWDYRYCWLRDASFTVTALLDAGYPEEATAFARWLRRAVAGDPDDVQIMYGVAGERRLTETELDWLPGHGGARPVRVGNAAHGQRQLDVYGEVFDLLHTVAVRRGRLSPDALAVARVMIERLAQRWSEPDEGIWEVRGAPQQFTHSKVMAWAAVDRWLGIIDALGLDDDRDRWEALAAEIHAEVCAKGFDERVGAFTQAYGSEVVDASLLQVALVGFLPPEDERVIGTVDAIQRELSVEGFVLRYRSEDTDDGLPSGEGAFILTTCWLVEALAVLGRHDEATALFERVLAATNDVGLLAEEIDPRTGAHLGNTPQAFSHLGVIVSALTLAQEGGPAERRRRLSEHPPAEAEDDGGGPSATV